MIHEHARGPKRPLRPEHEELFATLDRRFAEVYTDLERAARKTLELADELRGGVPMPIGDDPSVVTRLAQVRDASRRAASETTSFPAVPEPPKTT